MNFSENCTQSTQRHLLSFKKVKLVGIRTNFRVISILRHLVLPILAQKIDILQCRKYVQLHQVSHELTGF